MPKQTYTVERAYLAPIYVHIQVEAESPEEAARLAMDETAYPWEGDTIDYESSRPTYIDGIWAGDQAYGDGGGAAFASLPIPTDLLNTEGRLIEALQRAEKHIATVCSETSETDLPDWYADLTFIREAMRSAGVQRLAPVYADNKGN
jgi:hypothetical protein